MNRVVLLAASVLFAACGSETDNNADGGITDVDRTQDADTGGPTWDTDIPSLLGDWFLCEDKDCNSVTYEGWRFQSDGKSISLFAEPPYLEGDETYCSSWKGDLAKHFEINGNILVVIRANKTKAELTILKLTKDRLVLSSTLDTTYYQRVEPPRLSGECDNQGPWLCPTAFVVPASGDLFCSWEYPCNTGKFRLICKNAGPTDLVCECWEADVKKTTFNVAKTCKDITLDSSVPIANKGCGWNILIP